MNTNVNFEAALGVLLLMGTCLVLLALALLMAHGLLVRKYGHVLKGLVAAVGVVGVYLCLMLGFSFASREKVLARGEEKHFCEVDCHLAYSVIDVTTAKSIGNPPDGAIAGGTFYIVNLKTRFDENTISHGRGDAPLTPNARALAVYDEQGRRYNLSAAGQRALELVGGGGTPLTTPLHPGESYTTALVFDLPAAIKNPTLLVNEAMLPTVFIIGHENSFRHAQTKFQLDAQAREPATARR
jgi:hypothetical protein